MLSSALLQSGRKGSGRGHPSLPASFRGLAGSRGKQQAASHPHGLNVARRHSRGLHPGGGGHGLHRDRSGRAFATCCFRKLNWQLREFRGSTEVDSGGVASTYIRSACLSGLTRMHGMPPMASDATFSEENDCRRGSGPAQRLPAQSVCLIKKHFSAGGWRTARAMLRFVCGFFGSISARDSEREANAAARLSHCSIPPC